jgi:hypothetical protein
LKKVPTPPPGYSKLVLIPAVPIVTGVAMVGLPFVLPVVLVIIALLVGALLSGVTLYSSTQSGGAPFVEHLLGSPAGQTLIHDTGPRPTPVSVCRHVLPTGMWSKLFLSLFIFLIGSAS